MAILSLPPIEYRPFEVDDVVVANGEVSTIVEIIEDCEAILKNGTVISTCNISLL